MIDHIISEAESERAVLVGLITEQQNETKAKEYLDELAFLADTAGAVTVKTFLQRIPYPNPRTFVGKGKLEEIRTFIEENDISMAIFDDDLSSKQVLNIERELKVKILDRTSLILDIFAKRARTANAKTQVELAQYQYLLPRLTRMWTHLERQRGGIGMRGPGETQIETDRRIILNRIAYLKEELKAIDKQKAVQRKNRGKLTRVALVGYTNAGKSTLMNAMLDLYGSDEIDIEQKKVMEEDMLFATLDTTVRKIEAENHHAFLLSDTVGFIHKLPHNLVEAFHSTLEEAKEADILVQVVDYHDPHFREQITVTNRTLKELGADHIPMLYVYNKSDLVSPDEIPGLAGMTPERVHEHLPIMTENSIYLSAKEQIGMEELIRLIEKKLSGGYRECTLLIPYTDGRAISYLNENAVVYETEYLEEGVRLRINCKVQDYHYYEKYLVP